MVANLSLFNWKSITEEFKTACDELDIGELVKEPK